MQILTWQGRGESSAEELLRPTALFVKKFFGHEETWAFDFFLIRSIDLDMIVIDFDPLAAPGAYSVMLFFCCVRMLISGCESFAE